MKIQQAPDKPKGETHYSDDWYVNTDYIQHVLPEATYSDVCWILDEFNLGPYFDIEIKKQWRRLQKIQKEAEVKRAKELANATGGFVI